MRRRLNSELSKLDNDERLRRAIAAAEQRGTAVPSRARTRLAVLEERRRAVERELTARIAAMMQPRVPRLPTLPRNFATTPVLLDFSPLCWRMIPNNLITLSREFEKLAQFYQPFRTPKRDRLPLRHARRLLKAVEEEFNKLVAEKDVGK